MIIVQGNIVRIVGITSDLLVVKGNLVDFVNVVPPPGIVLLSGSAAICFSISGAIALEYPFLQGVLRVCENLSNLTMVVNESRLSVSENPSEFAIRE